MAEPSWWMTNAAFLYEAGLWGWTVLILLYAAWRSFGDAEQDPIRESGPGPWKRP